MILRSVTSQQYVRNEEAKQDVPADDGRLPRQSLVNEGPDVARRH